jgi:hypothetical protein
VAVEAHFQHEGVGLIARSLDPRSATDVAARSVSNLHVAGIDCKRIFRNAASGRRREGAHEFVWGTGRSSE